MITYLYWAAIIGIAAAALVFLLRMNALKAGVITSLAIVFVGWAAYFFHFQQVFVKRYGGVMTISVPDGHRHIAATWKDENLWVENYDPATNTCHFNEYSKGSLLQGKVSIKNCNPLLSNTRFEAEPQESQ